MHNSQMDMDRPMQKCNIVGDKRRYILASDGLWETLSLEAIAKYAFMHECDPQKCASTLLKRVRLQCAKFNGVRQQPFKDDTTIAVIDVTPEPNFPDSNREASRALVRRSPPWFCCHIT